MERGVKNLAPLLLERRRLSVHLGRENNRQFICQFVDVLGSVIVEILDVERERYAAARTGHDLRRAVYVRRPE